MKNNIEALGNKSLLEKSINIRASDYRFEDKRKYYLGLTVNGRVRPRTKIADLVNIAAIRTDFTEDDIVLRTNTIIDTFMDELEANGLLRTE